MSQETQLTSIVKTEEACIKAVQVTSIESETIEEIEAIYVKPENKPIKVLQGVQFTEFAVQKEEKSPRKTQTKKNPLTCEVCDRTLSNVLSLARHIKALHPKTEKEKFECKICHKSLGSTYTLQNHLLRVHAEGRPRFFCDFCPYSTTWKSNLSEHVQVHVREPFACDLCTYRTQR